VNAYDYSFTHILLHQIVVNAFADAEFKPVTGDYSFKRFTNINQGQSVNSLEKMRVSNP
jgi:hypothetical protein